MAKTKKKSTKHFTAMSGLEGFKKNGKNADGVNISFDEIVHMAQKNMQKSDGVKVSLELIRNSVRSVCSAIFDILGEGSKVCVTVPQLGNFKTGGAYNTSTSGKKFWALIDKYSATWSYNYKGGSHEKQLKKLAAEIIYPFFEKYFKEYLTEKAQKIAKKSDRILLHFFYSCWNGVGWFKKFADDFNAQVKKTHDISTLEKSCILARKNSGNSLIAKGGEKMERMFTMITVKRGAKIFLITALIGGLGFGIYKGVKYLKNNDK